MPSHYPAQPADGPQASAIWTPKARRRFGKRLSEISMEQHGVVTLAQLRGLGLTASAVRSRVQEGSLRSPARGCLRGRVFA